MPQTKLADCEGQLSALKDAGADQDETLSDLEEDLKKQKQRYDELTVQNESLRKEAQAEHERNIEEEKRIKELEAQVKALQESGAAEKADDGSEQAGIPNNHAQPLCPHLFSSLLRPFKSSRTP